MKRVVLVAFDSDKLRQLEKLPRDAVLETQEEIVDVIRGAATQNDVHGVQRGTYIFRALAGSLH